MRFRKCSTLKQLLRKSSYKFNEESFIVVIKDSKVNNDFESLQKIHRILILIRTYLRMHSRDGG